MTAALCLALGVLPVLAFLAGLVVLDSFRLVRRPTVVRLLLLGSAAAVTAAAVNPLLQEAVGVDARTFTRALGPLVEETLKGAVIVAAIERRRVGFLVDAAIWGFALGAAFAAVENVMTFLALGTPHVALWLVRGFGTAVMHGVTTALFAVVSVHLHERRPGPAVYLPGFLLAWAVHAAYNRFYLSPALSAAVVLAVLPAVFGAVYRISERATREWLGRGFDVDQELLASILRGEALQTPVGRYLLGLRQRFPPDVVVDMLCLVRLRVELSIKAKGLLLMRDAGFEPPTDPETASRFAELRHLESSIGATGRLALRPIFHTSRRDLWQLHVLRVK